VMDGAGEGPEDEAGRQPEDGCVEKAHGFVGVTRTMAC
jgi:hypothetical protein